jgi:hypothetical protein
MSLDLRLLLKAAVDLKLVDEKLDNEKKKEEVSFLLGGMSLDNITSTHWAVLLNIQAAHTEKLRSELRVKELEKKIVEQNHSMVEKDQLAIKSNLNDACDLVLFEILSGWSRNGTKPISDILFNRIKVVPVETVTEFLNGEDHLLSLEGNMFGESKFDKSCTQWKKFALENISGQIGKDKRLKTETDLQTFIQELLQYNLLGWRRTKEDLGFRPDFFVNEESHRFEFSTNKNWTISWISRDDPERSEPRKGKNSQEQEEKDSTSVPSDTAHPRICRSIIEVKFTMEGVDEKGSSGVALGQLVQRFAQIVLNQNEIPGQLNCACIAQDVYVAVRLRISDLIKNRRTELIQNWNSSIKLQRRTGESPNSNPLIILEYHKAEISSALAWYWTAHCAASPKHPQWFPLIAQAEPKQERCNDDEHGLVVNAKKTVEFGDPLDESLFHINFQVNNFWGLAKCLFLFPRDWRDNHVFPIKDSNEEVFALKLPNSTSDENQIDRELVAVAYLRRSGVLRGIPEIAVSGHFQIENRIYKCLLTKPYGKLLKSNCHDLDLIALGANLERILKSIHTVGVVHGDIKPSNVILLPDAENSVSLIDFGASRFTDSSEDSHLIRTKAYCSIIANRDKSHMCTPRDDIESLVYTMISLDVSNGTSSWISTENETDEEFAAAKMYHLNSFREEGPSWLTVLMSDTIEEVLGEEIPIQVNKKHTEVPRSFSDSQDHIRG